MSIQIQHHPSDRNEFVGTGVSRPGDAEVPLPTRLTQIARAAVSSANTSTLATKKRAWSNSYRAYNNQHFVGSKYLNKELYAGRSKHFVPKTRTAVRKNAAAAMQALFSSEDVVSVTAENNSDPMQSASAKALHWILNYRLDRTSARAGIPWLPICMGARMDADITGVCISKQYWEYEEVDEAIDFDTLPEEAWVLDPATNEYTVDPDQIEVPKKVVKDRPMVELIPPENIIVDEAAPWYDVVQGGAFVIIEYPMHKGEIDNMMRLGRQSKGGGGWLTIDIKGGQTNDNNRQAVRTTRGQGQDRHSPTSSQGDDTLSIHWVRENFVRYQGIDYHWWSLGDQHLTHPRRVEESYPALRGERPVVMGLGAIEPHNVYPMSPVESWQSLQSEINDIRNLRLDTVRQAISPITKIRRGGNVDVNQLKYKGPDANIFVTEPDDVTFDRAPDASQGSFAESNYLNNDFDELAGSFSQSSVQSNRTLNETVGGMRLLAGNANGLTEFDLRVWVETWVENVLRQLIKLEQYYETDEKLLALAGDKAQLLRQYQMMPGWDELEQADVTLRVNVGIGATDPMGQLQKFMAGAGMSMQIVPMLGPAVQGVKAKAILDEVWGKCGYRSSEQFFTFAPEGEPLPDPPPSPEEQKLQAEIEAERQRLDMEAARDQQKLAMESEREGMKIQTEQQKAQMEQAREGRKAILEQRKAQTEQAKAIQELRMMRERHALELQMMREKHDAQRAMEFDKSDTNLEVGLAKAELTLQELRAKAKAKEEAAKRDTELKEAAAKQEAENKKKIADAQAKKAAASKAAKTAKTVESEQNNKQLAEAIKAMTQAVQMMGQYMTAPKSVTLQKGKDGRVVGGTVKVGRE